MSRLSSSGYGFSIFLAVVLHLAVAGLFWIELPQDPRIVAPPTRQNIKASLVVVENQQVVRRQNEELKKQKAQQKALKQKEQQRKEALKIAKERQEREKIQKEKQAEEKRQKVLAEKERLELEKKKAEQKALQEKQREERRLADLRQEEQTLLEAAAEEDQVLLERQKAEQQRQEETLVLEQTDLIRKRITAVWIYPPNVKPDQEVTLKISTVPTGEVISVTVVRGSGNAALDRSVEQAVYKASPLPVPKDIVVFERHFRNFTILFRPENASW